MGSKQVQSSMRNVNTRFFRTAYFAALCLQPLGSHAANLSAPQVTELQLRVNDTLRNDDEWVNNAVHIFTQKVGEECAQQNSAARAQNLPACSQSDCAESLSMFTKPQNVSLSLSAYSSGIVMMRVSIQWTNRPLNTILICYDPSLTPAVEMFRKKLTSEHSDAT